MAASAVTFLQADLDDGKAPVQWKHGQGNTDVIRHMLREQQRSMAAMHAMPLFREFRGDVKQKGKGVVPEGPAVDDFVAEGQTRMFELIRHTALKEEKPLRGVWASFGKPYICLGELVEPPSQLPSLYRDEMAGQERAKNSRGAGKQRKPPANAPAAAPPGSPGPAPPGTATGPAPSTAGSRGPSRGSARRIGTAASLASLESCMSPDEVLELRLNKIKTVMRFGANDYAEAVFPQGPLKQAAHRAKMSQVRPGSFVDPNAASAEVTDPYIAYGQPPVAHHMLKPKPVHKPKELQDKGSTVFITQGQGGSGIDLADEDVLPKRVLGYQGQRRSSIGFTEKPFNMTSDQFDGGPGPSDFQDSDGDGEDGQAQAGGSAPSFKPLVPEAMPMRGDEDNPVYTWHNNFVRVRQRGRAALQAALYERVEGRFRARTVGPMAANLSSILMADLDLVKGKQVPYSTGAPPASPYLKMDSSWVELQQRAANAARAAQQLDPEELRVLQRFYDQLCALVEAQRMSDPLSLMVVHKVKVMLEDGTFLQRVMLENVLTHMGRFIASIGMKKHNKYLLSIFTFIAKCTGVNEQDFEGLVQQADLCEVVYNAPLPPSQMAAAAAAAAQGEVEDGRGSPSRGRGTRVRAALSKLPPRKQPSRLPPQGLVEKTDAAEDGPAVDRPTPSVLEEEQLSTSQDLGSLGS